MEIREVKGKKELKQFIRLPAQLHAGHEKWVPPIYRDEKKYFNPKMNFAFDYCDTTLALCFKNGKAVGRIMGIINHRYNKARKEKTARFSFLESINDPQVSHQLLQWVENWARSKAMEKIIGPFGMNYQDPQGLLMEGFEQEPAVSTNYNHPYLIDLLEKEAYSKEKDFVVYKIPLDYPTSELYKRIFDRVMERKHFQLLEFPKRSALRKYVLPILQLMNDCFEDIYGYSRLDNKELYALAKQYISFLDPRFIKVIEKNGALIGFIIAMPNLSAGIRKAKGYLFPFGFIKILNAAKKSKQLDLLLGGVKRGYQGLGLDAVLGFKTMETARKCGYTFMDSHLELESHYKVRAEMEKIGGVVYKKYRVFGKDL